MFVVVLTVFDLSIKKEERFFLYDFLRTPSRPQNIFKVVNTTKEDPRRYDDDGPIIIT